MLATRSKLASDNIYKHRLAIKHGAQKDQELREDKLIMQQPTIYSNDKDKIPLNKIKTGKNIINHRLFFKPSKQIVVESINKKK